MAMRQGTNQHVVLAWLSHGEPATNAQIKVATGLGVSVVSIALHHLHERGCIARQLNGKRANTSQITADGYAALGSALAPSTQRATREGTRAGDEVSYMLPSFVSSRREDCARYRACLFAFAGGGHARCPVACPHYAPAPRVHPHAYALGADRSDEP